MKLPFDSFTCVTSRRLLTEVTDIFTPLLKYNVPPPVALPT
jgi:hypothetical protein